MNSLYVLSQTKRYLLLLNVVVFCTAIISCKKDFGEVNTNPSVVTQPDIKFLLSYSEDKFVTYQGTEWIWEDMEQLFRYTQHVTSDPYELTSNVNTRYSNFYLQIAPNLFEIRRQINQMPGKESFLKMYAVTYVLQVLHALKVTDMNGSIPYSQAIGARYDGNFTPVYDDQQTLFNTWLGELDSAIAILGDNILPVQNAYGNSDIFYHSDFTKWTKLANTIKLRIAARLEHTDVSKTKDIFKSVMANATGPIDNDSAQLSYQSIDYFPFGNGADINYRSTRYATISIMNFLKISADPRLPVYFESNDLVGSFRDTLAKYNTSLPSFIDINDPQINFQGGPADWTIDPARANYVKNPFVVGNTNPGNSVSRYFLTSPINRKFFSPHYNNATSGQFMDVMVTNAESCLLVAEFIEKGYADGTDTKGTAEDWYKKGIASSIKTMNNIAATATSTTAFTGNGDAEVLAYLNNDQIKFNGSNDLERIYIQEYLNFFRNANEAFVFCRRTGYPKNVSSYYTREPFTAAIPRRWWLSDPGEVNRANYMAAMAAQGFTPNAQDVTTLSTQRIWYDKTAPDFGAGQ